METSQGRRLVNATEFKNSFGKYLDLSETTPIFIRKSGREKSVVISKDMYDKLEDNYWKMKAITAEDAGYLSVKDSKIELKKLVAQLKE